MGVHLESYAALVPHVETLKISTTLNGLVFYYPSKPSCYSAVKAILPEYKKIDQRQRLFLFKNENKNKIPQQIENKDGYKIDKS